MICTLLLTILSNKISYKECSEYLITIIKKYIVIFYYKNLIEVKKHKFNISSPFPSP